MEIVKLNDIEYINCDEFFKQAPIYCKDSRNVEILTFDELFERAKFIVEGAKQLSVVSELI